MNLATTSVTSALLVKRATTSREVEGALRLRYQVFVEETANQTLANLTAIESDEFDQYCDHLIVIDQVSDEIVGTYRLLPSQRASACGFYSETEFDLSRFEYRASALELGRSCVASAYRGSRVIQMLWSGVAEYLRDHPHTHLIGCASLHVETMHAVNIVYSMVRQHNIMTERYNVQPLASHQIADLAYIPTAGSEREALRSLPPLIKGYRLLGAEIAGEPAFDPLFGTADFFVVFETSTMTKRYQRHFVSSYQEKAHV